MPQSKLANRENKILRRIDSQLLKEDELKQNKSPKVLQNSG